MSIRMNKRVMMTLRGSSILLMPIGGMGWRRMRMIGLVVKRIKFLVNVVEVNMTLISKVVKATSKMGHVAAEGFYGFKDKGVLSDSGRSILGGWTCLGMFTWTRNPSK